MTKKKVVGLISVCLLGIALGTGFRPDPSPVNPDIKLIEELEEYKQALSKRDELLTQLFGRQPKEDWLSMDVSITWYSLSVDECDSDPDTAAHGKSRPFMGAISGFVVDTLNLKPGDKVAILSDDGKIANIVVYWDRMNPRYDKGNHVDIVAPSKTIAERWSKRPGRIVKI